MSLEERSLTTEHWTFWLLGGLGEQEELAKDSEKEQAVQEEVRGPCCPEVRRRRGIGEEEFISRSDAANGSGTLRAEDFLVDVTMWR